MDVAVAVGLITSGSTLTGVIIASVTTVRVQKNQMVHQRALAEAERQEARNAALRTMRHGMYETLLNRIDEITELASACWVDRPCAASSLPANETELALEKGLKTLDGVLNSVMLEGSVSVIEAAHKAKQVFRGEMIQIAKISLGNAGMNTTLQSLAPDEYEKCYERRVSAKYEIIRAAATMLQGTNLDIATPASLRSLP
jgi:hypothetical protein